MARKRNAAPMNLVLEEKTFECSQDITPAMRREVYWLARDLPTVLEVIVFTREIKITFRNFHAEVDKHRDLNLFATGLQSIAASAA